MEGERRREKVREGERRKAVEGVRRLQKPVEASQTYLKEDLLEGGVREAPVLDPERFLLRFHPVAARSKAVEGEREGERR